MDVSFELISELLLFFVFLSGNPCHKSTQLLFRYKTPIFLSCFSENYTTDGPALKIAYPTARHFNVFFSNESGKKFMRFQNI